MEFEHRPIDRSELYIADEVGLTGTLAEITPLRSIDDQALPEDRPVLSLLAQRYRQAVTGERPHPAVELEVLPG
jgi:branched-chain amino acid aminotransferase